jgi:hypothetical protein
MRFQVPLSKLLENGGLLLASLKREKETQSLVPNSIMEKLMNVRMLMSLTNMNLDVI